MRRVFGGVLLGLGVFLLLLAPLLKYQVYPSLAKAPFEKVKPSVSEGKDVVRFNSAEGAETTIPLIRATRTVVPDVEASTEDVIVYDVSVCIVVVQGDTPSCLNKDDNRLLSITTDRVAFDRKTAMAVNDPRFAEAVNGDKTKKHEGLSYKFPFGTEKRDYPFFDTTLAKAFPMKYVEQDTVEGVDVYRFEQVVPPGPIEIIEGVPGTYQNKRTVWIEPRTGVIVRGQEEQQRTFSEGDLAGQTALAGTIAFTDQTVSNSAETAKDGASSLGLLGGRTQVILLGLGLVLIVAGLALLLTRRGTESDAAVPNPRGRRRNRSETRV
jgi:hypothetical protein